MHRAWPVSATVLASLACQAPTVSPFVGDDTADTAVGTCLFGESWDQWDEGLPDLAVEDGWSVADASSNLWDGALEQILVSLDYPGGPTTFEGALAETDNGEFLWRELSDQRNGDAYLAWGYMGGDNFHGAIFPLDSDVPVARLADPDVGDCTVFRTEVAVDCEVGDNETADDATQLGTTGELVEVDAFDRIVDGTLTGTEDVDWYRVDFETESVCFSCFHPYVLLDADTDDIEEVCVFVSALEAKKRGTDLECFNGAATTEGALTGCCTSNPSDNQLQLWTDWNHDAGDGSTMYIRVKSASSETCESYTLVYGHFAG